MCERENYVFRRRWSGCQGPVPQDAGEGSFIWHMGPVDRSPRLTLPCFFLSLSLFLDCFYYPSGYLEAGQGEDAPAALRGDETVSVGTKVYGDGRGKHVISVQQADTATDGTLLLHTHKHTHPPVQAVPPSCRCPCMCRAGPDVKSARCFSEPPPMGWLAAHHPTSTNHHVCNQREEENK